MMIIAGIHKIYWNSLTVAIENKISKLVLLIMKSNSITYTCNFDSLPKTTETRIQINNQIRLQKMLSYIYENYRDQVTLEDIARAADISKSEAGRCFQAYMGCSPVDALIQYRLQTARQMLSEKTHTLQEISYACGFNSVNYFSRQFRKKYGYAPGKMQKMGK